MNYESIIHSFIDEIVDNKDAIMIKELPNDSEIDLTFLIVTTGEDVARLIGKKGSVASALREALSIAGKLENKHIHLKFESYDSKEDEN